MNFYPLKKRETDMSLKQNDEYYEQQREMREEERITAKEVFSELLKLLVLMGLWYVGFLALYAFTG